MASPKVEGFKTKNNKIKDEYKQTANQRKLISYEQSSQSYSEYYNQRIDNIGNSGRSDERTVNYLRTQNSKDKIKRLKNMKQQEQNLNKLKLKYSNSSQNIIKQSQSSSYESSRDQQNLKKNYKPKTSGRLLKTEYSQQKYERSLDKGKKRVEGLAKKNIQSSGNYSREDDQQSKHNKLREKYQLTQQVQQYYQEPHSQQSHQNQRGFYRQNRIDFNLPQTTYTYSKSQNRVSSLSSSKLIKHKMLTFYNCDKKKFYNYNDEGYLTERQMIMRENIENRALKSLKDHIQQNNSTAQSKLKKSKSDSIFPKFNKLKESISKNYKHHQSDQYQPSNQKSSYQIVKPTMRDNRNTNKKKSISPQKSFSDPSVLPHNSGISLRQKNFDVVYPDQPNILNPDLLNNSYSKEQDVQRPVPSNPAAKTPQNFSALQSRSKNRTKINAQQQQYQLYISRNKSKGDDNDLIGINSNKKMPSNRVSDVYQRNQGISRIGGINSEQMIQSRKDLPKSQNMSFQKVQDPESQASLEKSSRSNLKQSSKSISNYNQLEISLEVKTNKLIEQQKREQSFQANPITTGVFGGILDRGIKGPSLRQLNQPNSIPLRNYENNGLSIESKHSRSKIQSDKQVSQKQNNSSSLSIESNSAASNQQSKSSFQKIANRQSNSELYLASKKQLTDQYHHPSVHQSQQTFQKPPTQQNLERDLGFLPSDSQQLPRMQRASFQYRQSGSNLLSLESQVKTQVVKIQAKPVSKILQQVQSQYGSSDSRSKLSSKNDKLSNSKYTIKSQRSNEFLPRSSRSAHNKSKDSQSKSHVSSHKNNQNSQLKPSSSRWVRGSEQASGTNKSSNQQYFNFVDRIYECFAIQTELYEKRQQQQGQIEQQLSDVIIRIEQHLEFITQIALIATQAASIYDQGSTWVYKSCYLTLKKYYLQRVKCFESLQGKKSCFRIGQFEITDDQLKKVLHHKQIKNIRDDIDTVNKLVEKIIYDYRQYIQQNNDSDHSYMFDDRYELGILLEQYHSQIKGLWSKLAEQQDRQIMQVRIFKLMQIGFLFGQLSGKRIKEFQPEINQDQFDDYYQDYYPYFERIVKTFN